MRIRIVKNKVSYLELPMFSLMILVVAPFSSDTWMTSASAVFFSMFQINEHVDIERKHRHSVSIIYSF